MKSQAKHHDDTKLLLAVAGVVATGAVGIAVLAGLYQDREERPRPRSPEVSDSAPQREALTAEPASFSTTPASEPTALVSPVSGPEPAGDAAELPGAAPVITLDENLVRGGLAAWESREFDLAARHFAAECEARPDNAWTRYMLGLSLWKAGRADEAAVEMQRSAEVDPGSTRTWINLSRIRNDLGAADEALAAADAALAIDAADATALFLRGRSLYNAGRVDEALEALEASIAAAPDNGYVHNLRGLILIERGSTGHALEALTRAAEILPDVAYVQNNLGMALELDGERAQALVAYRRAVELDPAHRKAAVNVARVETLIESKPVPEAAAEGETEIASVEPDAPTTAPELSN